MDYNPIKLDQASDAPVDIHKYKAITIYPFIQWSRNNIYRIICIDEPVANCFSLSLFFGFQITRTKKFIKEWRAKVGNFQFIPLSPRDYFHRVKLVRLWKILLSLVNRIFRALCSNKGSLCFQSLLLQFFDKIQLPLALLSAIFQTEKFRVGPESILSRIIRLSKTS